VQQQKAGADVNIENVEEDTEHVEMVISLFWRR
jgi:hypothetical protein